MSFSVLFTETVSCEPGHSMWMSARAASGTVVSVGLQNGGYATELEITQMFVVNATTAFAQVTNRSPKPVQWRVALVVASAVDEAEPTLLAPEVKSVELGSAGAS